MIGGTCSRSVRIKTQLYANFSLGEWEGQFVFIVVPKLNKDCILGVHILKRFKSKLNFDDNTVILKETNSTVKISLNKDEPKNIRVIDLDYTNEICHIQGVGENVIREDNFVDYNMGACKNISTIEPEEIKTLSVEMIIEKVEAIDTLSVSEKQSVVELILGHNKLFNKEPGLINVSQHELKVRDN